MVISRQWSGGISICLSFEAKDFLQFLLPFINDLPLGERRKTYLPPRYFPSTTLSSLHKAFLHPIRQLPPSFCFFILTDPFHICLEIGPGVLEISDEKRKLGEMVDAVIHYVVSSDSS